MYRHTDRHTNVPKKNTQSYTYRCMMDLWIKWQMYGCTDRGADTWTYQKTHKWTYRSANGLPALPYTCPITTSKMKEVPI